MIFEVGLDCDALETSDGFSQSSRASHQRFLDLWLRYGVLVYEDNSLVKQIETFHPEIRKRWKVAMKHARLVKRAGASFRSIQKDQDLVTLKGLFQLACVEEVRGACLGLDNEQLSKTYDELDLELCLFEFADQSRAAKQARDSGESEIVEGTSTEETWRVRFESLANHTRKKIVVVDRYAFLRHLDSPTNSGLRNFLSKLASCQPRESIKIELFLLAPEDRPASSYLPELGNLIEESKTNGILGPVTGVFVFPHKFKQHAHDRYVRFDNASCWLGSGLEVLDGTSATRDCSFHLSYEITPKRRRERNLRNAQACQGTF